MKVLHLWIKCNKSTNGCFFPQGQVEASISLETAAPVDAEFYVVVQGSTLTHVTTARRDTDALSLRFTVPGILTSNSFYILFSSHHFSVFHRDLLSLLQAMPSVKSLPSHPTITRRSRSSCARGKRLWSTVGMLPRRLPSV